MVPDYATVDKAKALMKEVRDGQVVTQEEADSETGTASTDGEVVEPGTLNDTTATDTAADGTTTDGAATDGTATADTTQTAG